MRTAIPAHTHLVQGRRHIPLALLAPMVAFSLFAAFPLSATEQITAPRSPATHSTTRKAAHSRSKTADAATPAAAPQLEPPPPAAPKLPDWPANEHPVEATVVWNSQGLSIEAANSSLSQILKDVASATGARVEGMNTDQRIFGSYGPGKARDVLAKLLEGSGYNVLMIGDQGQGTPREIVLTGKPSGNAPPVFNNLPASNEDTPEADEPPPEQPDPPQPPPNLRNGFAPGAPPRTPQQIMQEMQQRQQQQQTQQPQPNDPQ